MINLPIKLGVSVSYLDEYDDEVYVDVFHGTKDFDLSKSDNSFRDYLLEPFHRAVFEAWHLERGVVSLKAAVNEHYHAAGSVVAGPEAERFREGFIREVSDKYKEAADDKEKGLVLAWTRKVR